MSLKLDTSKPKASRARARTKTAAAVPDVDAQVRYVVQRMAAHEWAGDAEVMALAAQWGISEAAVRDRSAQASRYLRLFAPEQREALRLRWLLELDAITMRGEDRDRVAAIRAGADLAAMVTQKHEVLAGGAFVACETPEQQADVWEAMARAARSGKEGT